MTPGQGETPAQAQSQAEQEIQAFTKGKMAVLPQTGDEIDVSTLSLAAITALLGAGFILVSKKKDEEDA